MKKDLYVWQLWGFATASLLGTLLHFLYEWTNESAIAALFSGVNESTWEHMKLLYFPLFVFALIQSFFFRDYKSFWCVKLLGTMVGLLLIPVLFYTYNGAIGPSPDWLNIAIFFISAAATFFMETILFKKDSFTCKYPKSAFVLLCLIGLLFVIFTFATPHLLIFKDPLNETYGI